MKKQFTERCSYINGCCGGVNIEHSHTESIWVHFRFVTTKGWHFTWDSLLFWVIFTAQKVFLFQSNHGSLASINGMWTPPKSGFEFLICSIQGSNPVFIHIHTINWQLGRFTMWDIFRSLAIIRMLIFINSSSFTHLKTNMDTQNDGLGMVTPFKYGYFWYLCSISAV